MTWLTDGLVFVRLVSVFTCLSLQYMLPVVRNAAVPASKLLYSATQEGRAAGTAEQTGCRVCDRVEACICWPAGLGDWPACVVWTPESQDTRVTFHFIAEESTVAVDACVVSSSRLRLHDKLPHSRPSPQAADYLAIKFE